MQENNELLWNSNVTCVQVISATVNDHYNDQWHIVNTLKKITRSQFEQAFEKLKVGHVEPASEDVDTSDIDNMISKCNVLSYLIQKAQNEHQLTHTDRLTLLHTIGHFQESGRIKLHHIISKTFNYDWRITERWFKRLKGSPVSCPKIRDWQGHITPAVGCYCQFPKSVKKYPTPLLHVKPDLKIERTTTAPILAEPDATKKTEPGIKQQQDHKTEPQDIKDQGKKIPRSEISSTNIDIEKLLENYVKIRHDFRQVEKQKSDTEALLEQFFKEKKCDSLPVKMGVLRRVKQGEEIKWIIEM